MEENKKSSFSVTNILFIVAIFIIFGMAFVIGEMDKYNDNLSKEVQELESQVNDLKNNVNTEETYKNLYENALKEKDDLQNKIYSVENTIAETNEAKKDNITYDFSLKEVRTAIENYFNTVGNLSHPYLLLKNIGFNVNSDQYDDNEIAHYQNTNIKYSDFKERMLNYVSKEFFEANFENDHKENEQSSYLDYKNQNGMLYVRFIFENGTEKYITNVSHVNGNNYIVKIILCDPEMLVDSNQKIEDLKGTDSEYTFKFTISSYNGKCVIDSCEW